MPPVRIAVSGSSGLVGDAVVRALEARGARVSRLVRRRDRLGADDVYFEPTGDELDAGALGAVDGVVHLAGHNLAQRRWSAAEKRRIRDSRVEGTARIARALARLEPPPPLVNASAVGFYGHRGAEPLDESSPPGTGFLAEVCRDWEGATAAAEEAGARVTHLRLGLVLSDHGGVLPRMLKPFRLGLGGRVGDGSQYMSWIALDDLVRVIVTALEDERYRGPINAVAPEPVTNARFTQVLGSVLGRPTWAPLPAFVVRAVLGEMGRELLLASTRVLPRGLEVRGFDFGHPRLESTLRQLVGR